MPQSDFLAALRGAARSTLTGALVCALLPLSLAAATPAVASAPSAMVGSGARMQSEKVGLAAIAEVVQARTEAVLPGGSPRSRRVFSLLSGDAQASEAALTQAYGAYRDAVATPREGLRGEVFSSVTSRVVPVSTQWQGDVATVRVRELVTAHVQGAPVPWEYALPQRFTVAVKEGHAQVTSVTMEAEPEMVRGEDLPRLKERVRIEALPDAPQGSERAAITQQDVPSTPVSGGGPDSDENRSSVIFGGRTPHELQEGEYDHRAAANYASKFALEYNPDYRYWDDNDCTNFASQSVWQGGWELEGNEVQNHEHWWYLKEPREQSGTWIYAPAFVNFLRTERRSTLRKGLNFMAVGDIANLYKKKEERVSHAMIVTTSENGYPYFSYHSVDTRNRSLKSLIERAPQKDFSYIGWRMRTTH